MASAIVDTPQPDSPTSPNDSPRDHVEADVAHDALLLAAHARS